MSAETNSRKWQPGLRSAAALAITFLLSVTIFAQDNHSSGGTPPSAVQNDENPPVNKAPKSADSVTTRIRIQVNDANDKPVPNASVYVRYNESGGFLHHDKLSELSLKTNQEGSVKTPEVPQGKIMIQVIAKGWHTFGRWYEIDKDAESVSIKLDPAPHWY
jgi:hypothetical protein